MRLSRLSEEIHSRRKYHSLIQNTNPFFYDSSWSAPVYLCLYVSWNCFCMEFLQLSKFSNYFIFRFFKFYSFTKQVDFKMFYKLCRELLLFITYYWYLLLLLFIFITTIWQAFNNKLFTAINNPYMTKMIFDVNKIARNFSKRITLILGSLNIANILSFVPFSPLLFLK